MKIVSTLKRCLLGLMVVVQIGFYPVASFAEETPSSDVSPAASQEQEEQTAEPTSTPTETPIEEPSAPPPDTSTATSSTQQEETPSTPATATGPTSPNGAAAGTYTFNSSTGMWENDYYIWNPATGQTTPKTAQEYSYNPATGVWDTLEWRFDAPSGKYVQNINPILNLLGGSSISNTGPGSNNGIGLGSTSDGFFSGFYNVRISNIINSSATSGFAGVLQNTVGGNALSGDANGIVNLLNMLGSSWGSGNGDIDVFQADINGDVNGDLYLDPSLVINNNSGTANISRDTDRNLQVTTQASGRIDNEVNLNATSGDAEVSGNTTAGSAGSGDANAVANIINLMNSSIKAGHSFVGVLNINGNLNGDILLPPWLLQALIAATGPGSNSNISQTNNSTLNASFNDNQTINNDVDANATSGNASVANNNTAGSATTGTANTNITLLNLTGKKVVTKNALLVVVNVFGKWVGLIMNAPEGQNTATLGISNNGGNASISDNTNENVNINANSDQEINNDINVNATSGDASVHDNTIAGDAESGDANAGANIVNLINTDLEVSDWFGVLFINVFGSWIGSFGVDTPAGNAPGQAAAGVAAGQAGAAGGGSGDVFAFIPRALANSQVNGGAGGGTTTGQGGGDNQAQQAAAGTTSAAADTNKNNNVATNNSHGTSPSTGNSLWIPGAGVLAGVLWLGAERLLVLVQQRRKLV